MIVIVITSCQSEKNFISIENDADPVVITAANELKMIFAPQNAGGKLEIIEDENVLNSFTFNKDISFFNLSFKSNGEKIQMRIILDGGVVKLSGIVIAKKGNGLKTELSNRLSQS